MTLTQRTLALGILSLASIPAAARADSLFAVSGKIALADGVVAAGTKIKFQVDLDRNGKLESFETLSASAGADGSYKLKYELDPTKVDLQFVKAAAEIIATYKKDGLDGLLKGGPLPVVLSFEREGYTTIVKRLKSMADVVDLDAVLAPLSAVHCADSTCLSSSGDVRLSGFPGGTRIARAYANAYDPGADATRFPGNFSDDADNLLISSGFAEINLYDANGKPIHEVSAPVAVRFEAKRAQWPTLPDLTPGSGRIELPMYSFDQGKAEWVREGDGELQLADGTPVPEENLTAIRAGSFEQQVFVAFDTTHFSTFNCDAPIEERACVRGRVLDEATGEALIGAEVNLLGVSYEGNAGGQLTGRDGRFAADVMKSENPGEDVDRNGTRGQTFSARLAVTSAAGVFLGSSFDTPRAAGSAELGGCRPNECKCLDLGDIAVSFEAPRLCQVTVQTTASGRDLLGAEGPIAAGAAVVGAKVRGQLTGNLTLPQVAVSALCHDQVCSAGVIEADGSLTFAVPVIGDAAQLGFNADFTIKQDGDIHVYSGSVSVAGCAADQGTLETPVALQLDHASAGELGDFIKSLGDAPKLGKEVLDPLGCGCRIAGGKPRTSLGWLSGFVVSLVLAVRRRSKSKGKRSP